jgi:hypothetical protein
VSCSSAGATACDEPWPLFKTARHWSQVCGFRLQFLTPTDFIFNWIQPPDSRSAYWSSSVSALGIIPSWFSKRRLQFQSTKKKKQRNPLKILLTASYRFALLIQAWRWRRYILPKRLLTFNGLHGVTSKKTELFKGPTQVHPHSPSLFPTPQVFAAQTQCVTSAFGTSLNRMSRAIQRFGKPSSCHLHGSWLCEGFWKLLHSSRVRLHLWQTAYSESRNPSKVTNPEDGKRNGWRNAGRFFFLPQRPHQL